MKHFVSAAAVALAVVAASQSAAQTWGSTTPLHKAVLDNNMFIAEFLIRDDASMMDAKDQHGETPLHIAAENGDLPMAQLLIDNGASK